VDSIKYLCRHRAKRNGIPGDRKHLQQALPSWIDSCDVGTFGNVVDLMKLFPLLIGLLAVLSIGIPSLAAESSWGFPGGSGGYLSALKTISFDSYEEAFAIPMPKSIAFKSYEEAFTIPKLKPITFDSYAEAFAIPKPRTLSVIDFESAFVIPKPKPLSVTNYSEAFIIPKPKPLSFPG
jgi:hypothetical protein